MADSNKKRVAKNTLFLYFRMILIMVVSLYTSRVILAQLGIRDYGINNVVGGVVSMFAFLNSSMATATQRFLTYALGKGDGDRLRKTFAASMNIHIFIALVIVLLAETIGLWFVNAKLVIPQDRMFAANVVYQFSILSFCVSIIQVPYDAVLIAHEKMSIYAYISILETILKLVIVYMLSISPFDKLITYSILFFAVTLFIRFTYQIYCKKHYAESKFMLFWDKDLYRQMSGFAGWNLFGSLAWLCRNQGLNIILNLFFGPVVNAARGVANQVSGAVMNFISNFQTALNPQITKEYAVGQIKEMEKLAYLGIKFSYIILFMLAFPLMLNIQFVLGIWLVKVPEWTAIFVILTLIDSLVGNIFGTPLMTSLSATGNIRNYQIVVSLIILFILPVGYVALRLGAGPTSVFYITIIFNFISGFVRFLYCRSQIGYSLKKMFVEVLVPIGMLMIFAIPLPVYLKIAVFTDENLFNFVILSMLAVFTSGLASWFICMKSHERQVILDIVRNKLHKG